MSDYSNTEIELAVTRLYDIRQNLIVSNVHYGFYLHECDLLIARPSGYLIEVEIKRSKSDLKADFKKPHRQEAREAKQLRIKELYYAVPEELLEAAQEWVPERHGLIVIRRRGFGYAQKGYAYASVIRRAKAKPNARPITDKEYASLARLGSLRVWGLKRIIVDYKKRLNDIGKTGK